MFRSRRSSFLAAAVLLLAACGGGGDSADRQRNEAIEALCTYSPTGTVDPADGRVTLSFCEEALSYSLIIGDNPGSDGMAPASGGVTFDATNGAQIVVHNVASGYLGGATIERVSVEVGPDNTVSITAIPDKVSTTACLTINDNDTVLLDAYTAIVSATVTCEGAKYLNYTFDGADPSNANVDQGRFQWNVQSGEETITYEVFSMEETVLEAGTIALTGMPKYATVTVTGGTLSAPAEETTTTVEGESQEPGAEETTTTVEGAAAEETTTSAAGGGEMTLEEKWKECSTPPVVTFDKAEVERTGLLAYSVKWPCLKYMNGEGFDQSVWHSFNGSDLNQTWASGEELSSSISGDTYTYSSQVGAGTHEVLISVYYSGSDHGWYDNARFDEYVARFTIADSVAASFDQCSKNDIKIARGKLTMDCDITGMFEFRLWDEWTTLPAKNGTVDLSTMADGWVNARLWVESGAYTFLLDALYCARKCDTARGDLKVEHTVGDDNYWTFKVTLPTWCAEPLVAYNMGSTYRMVTKGVREKVDEDLFFENEFGIIVDPDAAMVRIGNGYYLCFDPYGNIQSGAQFADFIITEDPAEAPETTTTVEAPATTAAPSPVTTVDAGPVADVPVNVLVPQPGGAPAEIQVPSNSSGLGVSAASIEAVLAAAKTDVPVVLATFDTGDKVALRRGRDAVLKVPAGAKSVTFTAFKKDGTKVESTATLVTVKPLVKVAIKDASSGGSGLPVLPIGAALVVVLLAAGAVVVRRRSVTTGD